MKLQISRFWVALVALAMTGTADASTGTGKILQVAAYRDTPVVFVLLDNQPALASCANNPAWTYVFRMNTDQDKKIYAMLLEAHATGRTVAITGTGTCADFAGIESGQYILNN